MNGAFSGSISTQGLFSDWQSQRATMRAWEDFLVFRDIERTRMAGVRREIVESWSRSLGMGVDASAKLAPVEDNDESFLSLRLQNAELLDAARRPFAQIETLLAGAGAIFILTDAKGTVLEQIGDPRTLDAARKIHLVRGGKWAETTIGTNGIGTALREGKPTVVHASEHFCEGVKEWSCAAAPVRDPVDQRILGAVDLSGPPGIFRPHNLALIASVAREIEAELTERQERRRVKLLEAFLDNNPMKGSADRVVILDQIGRVMYHRAPAYSDKAGPTSDLRLGRQLMTLSDQMSDLEIAQAMPPNMQPSGVSRLILDGKFSGAALILPGRRRPAETVSKPLRIPGRDGADGDSLTLIGTAPEFTAAIDLARRVAGAGAPVLIQGETGAGKELFARLIHAEMKSKSGPFITVNCGAISQDLFGSELFGHAPGAYTGASRDGKPGKFELADGGVLCLDEIGELPLDLQPYLLRALEQRAVYRLGCSKRRKIDVQLVGMTNRNLGQEIEAGRFRRDLYYRIGTVTIEVPSLRKRTQDIRALADHFNADIAKRQDKPLLDLSDESWNVLHAYHWPGNVRELRNLFERLHLMARDVQVDLSDLPTEIRTAVNQPASSANPPDATNAPLNLEDIEELAIRRALIAEKGNLTRVASALGVSRPTLYRKLKAYGIRRTYE